MAGSIGEAIHQRIADRAKALACSMSLQSIVPQDGDGPRQGCCKTGYPDGSASTYARASSATIASCSGAGKWR